MTLCAVVKQSAFSMIGKANPYVETPNRVSITCLRRAEQIMHESLLESVINSSNFRANLYTQSNEIELIIIKFHKILYIARFFLIKRHKKGCMIFG